MFRIDFSHCSQGLRDEQLDRFVVSETGRCKVFMMADGYACCSVNPHYVDWLAEQLSGLHATGLNSKSAANEISRTIAEKKSYPGKASVAFVISDEQNYLYTTLGDTRIYWPIENQRTNDHSVAQLAVQRGECSPKQLRFHPFRNRLLQHAGDGHKHVPEWMTRPFRDGECLLLCTDGFWSLLEDQDICNVADNKALELLVNRIMKLLPPDNFSAVMLRAESADASGRSTPGK